MIEEAISRGILPEIKKRKDTMVFTKCINLNTKRKGGEIPREINASEATRHTRVC